MTPVVIDASVTLALLLDEPTAADVGKILTQSICSAPWLWRLEVANVLLVRERRRTFSANETARLLDLLDGLPVELVPDLGHRPARALIDFARPHQLTAYDATYLELAMVRGIPLFTFDKNLKAAARREGVRLIESG